VESTTSSLQRTPLAANGSPRAQRVTPFKTIRARAETRKGGAEALAKLMPPKPDPKALSKLRDDRVLAEMTKRVFSAGFAWSVIESKWPGFEEAFLGFEPPRLLSEPDEFWHRLTMDARIVRNGAKIMSVRENARFVLDIAKEHGSFGNSGQMLLRFLGYDAFVTSKDVVACLRDAGLDIAESPTSKRDLAKIQEQFNAWAKETALPYRHLSLICAMSIGENYEGDRYEGDEVGSQK
jgi:3-methyladenine DNA glycosylase Tag